MNRARKPRSVSATVQGLRLLERAKAEKRDGEGRPLTYECLADLAGVSDKTVKRFFKGENVDRRTALAIIQALEISEEGVISQNAVLVSKTIQDIEDKQDIKPERAHKLIENIEEEFNKLKATENPSLRAMEWLKANRFLLSKEAAKSVVSSNDIEELNQFSEEIRKYLQLVYYCLEIGTWDFMDEALKDTTLPITRTPQVYADALVFIKDHKVNKELTSEESTEVLLCLDYLINTLPIRF